MVEATDFLSPYSTLTPALLCDTASQIINLFHLKIRTWMNLDKFLIKQDMAIHR